MAVACAHNGLRHRQQRLGSARAEPRRDLSQEPLRDPVARSGGRAGGRDRPAAPGVACGGEGAGPVHPSPGGRRRGPHLGFGFCRRLPAFPEVPRVLRGKADGSGGPRCRSGSTSWRSAVTASSASSVTSVTRSPAPCWASRSRAGAEPVRGLLRGACHVPGRVTPLSGHTNLGSLRGDGCADCRCRCVRAPDDVVRHAGARQHPQRRSGRLPFTNRNR